jgi:hypothetical protein
MNPYNHQLRERYDRQWPGNAEEDPYTLASAPVITRDKTKHFPGMSGEFLVWNERNTRAALQTLTMERNKITHMLSLFKLEDALGDPGSRSMIAGSVFAVAASLAQLLRQTCRLYPVNGRRIASHLCVMGVLVFAAIEPLGLCAPATPTVRKCVVSHGMMLVARLMLDTSKAVRLLD